MVCSIRIIEKPKLSNPILISGLPGIGFVSSIVTLHMIKELNTKLLADVRSSNFQDVATATFDGKIILPENKLYYFKRGDEESDLVFLYGNTQALNSYGQYELCGSILDLFKGLGGRKIITLGGMRVERASSPPRLYCAATDEDTLSVAVKHGAEIIRGGRIFGVAGLLIGLGKILGLRGLSLLSETPGGYPDSEAAYVAMRALMEILDLHIEAGGLGKDAEDAMGFKDMYGSGYIYGKGEKSDSLSQWFI